MFLEMLNSSLYLYMDKINIYDIFMLSSLKEYLEARSFADKILNEYLIKHIYISNDKIYIIFYCSSFTTFLH